MKNNFRVSFKKADVICFSHVYFVIMLYSWFWNHWLANAIMPTNSINNNYIVGIVMLSGLGIIILFLWFIVVGGLTGMFVTFDKADNW